MEHSSLSNLIAALEKGTHLHICVAFLGDCGNRKTRCTRSQAVHDRPVCKAIKAQPNGLAACYRCRMTVQRTLVKHKRPMSGFCTNGVFEYCKPVVHDNRVVCVIYVGNILTDDTIQRARLTARVDPSLLETMERDFSLADCENTARILESYIHFLFSRYGTEDKSFDPLVENIKNYIRENLGYDFSMEELARAFHYSEKYLGRMFKQRTGESIKAYCNRLKIDRAKQLLSNTDLSMQAIALQTGFGSATYFDRIFVNVTGVSPREYRNAAK